MSMPQGAEGSAPCPTSPGEEEPSISLSYQVLQADVPGGTPSVYFRPAALSDLDAVFALEEASYPADEMASREKLESRLQHAPDFFLVCVTPSQETHNGVASLGERVVGFTCGTCAHGQQLTHATMSHHEPQGTLLCIHSVVVDQQMRRKGIATRMLKAYQLYVQASTPTLTRMALLCKPDLVKLYEGAGFSFVGPSDVVHGQETWYEMKLDIQDD